MSTAGSGPDAARGPEPVDAQATVAAKSAAGKRVAFFRWRGIFALAGAGVLVAAGWLVFGDRIVRSTLAEAATKSLGTQVDIGALDLDVLGTSVELRSIAVAHPFDSTHNILEVGRARVVLERDPLMQKKIIIRDLTIENVRSGVRRAVPARRVAAGGFLPRALQEVNRWSEQFKVPLLSLTPIDTIKSIVLDPTQLRTVQAAQALTTRADSLRQDVTARVQSLRLRQTVDSAQVLIDSLKGKSPRSLGIMGTRNAIRDVRRLASRVDSTRRAVDALRRTVAADVDSLAAGVRAVNDAREADFAFAKSLLQLPSFHAPDIGPALFGPVSIDAFERGMYWIMLARDYAPPGLLPRHSKGPSRMRREGTTVRFVTRQGFPRFHLRQGSMTLALGEAAGAARGEYALRVSDVTTDPALVGRPLQFSLTRAAPGTAVTQLAISGTLDHAGARMRQAIEARASGFPLPSFALPALPLRAQPGAGISTFALQVNGDSVSGRWTINAPRVQWSSDSARAAQANRANTLESLVMRVISGIENIELSAHIGGTLRQPSLSVSSNLDRAVADNIRRVAGEEIARAEARVRAQVDALSARARTEMNAKIAAARAEAEQRLREATERLDRARAELAAQLRTLGGGIIGM
jgi:uncharacterized protein (TIGR03545 family)